MVPRSMTMMIQEVQEVRRGSGGGGYDKDGAAELEHRREVGEAGARGGSACEGESTTMVRGGWVEPCNSRRLEGKTKEEKEERP
eukprot:754531-Hanusia_phi.AAC.1